MNNEGKIAFKIATMLDGLKGFTEKTAEEYGNGEPDPWVTASFYRDLMKIREELKAIVKLAGWEGKP